MNRTRQILWLNTIFELSSETNVTRERAHVCIFTWSACVEPITGMFHTLWEFQRWLWRRTRFGKGQRRSCWFNFSCARSVWSIACFLSCCCKLNINRTAGSALLFQQSCLYLPDKTEPHNNSLLSVHSKHVGSRKSWYKVEILCACAVQTCKWLTSM